MLKGILVFFAMGLMPLSLFAKGGVSECPNLQGKFQCEASVENGKPFPKSVSSLTFKDNKGVRTFDWTVEFEMDGKAKKVVEKIVADGKKRKEDNELGKPLTYVASCKSQVLNLDMTFGSGKKKMKTFEIDKKGNLAMSAKLGGKVTQTVCTRL